MERLSGMIQWVRNLGTGSASWMRLLAILVSVLLAWSAEAQESGRLRKDLTQSSLEELMNIEVSSVSRKEQKLSRTAAAVFVITPDDIRRSGATSVPEALRLAPGVEVARINSSQWAVSARGFNGRFANKMLVLIDGRSVYTNLYSGVYWDQNDVMIEDVERIEVIRGPGATMWGANAVNGVINVITKSARDTKGVLASAGTAIDDQASVAMRYGGTAGRSAYYRAWAKSFRRDGMMNPPDAPGDYSWRQTRGGARLDWDVSSHDSLTIHGDVYRQSAGECVSANFPLQGRLSEDRLTGSGGYGLARWTRQLSNHSELALQAYLTVENRFEAYGHGRFRTADLDFQHRFGLGRRHDITWGLGYRRMHDSILAQAAAFIPPARSDNLYSSFVQDDISLVEDRLVLSLGSKFLHNAYTGFEIQPDARLLWTPARQHTAWVAVSRAVRTPSRRDRDLFIDFNIPLDNGMNVGGRLFGNSAFRSEQENAYEAGYRIQAGRNVGVDIAAFYSRYIGLQDLLISSAYYDTSATPARIVVPVTFNNARNARTHGMETALTWTVNSRWRLTGAHSWLELSELGGGTGAIPLTGFSDYNSPQHQFNVRSSADLTRRISFDVVTYRIGQLAGLAIPAYTRLDTNLAVKLTRDLELAVGGRNLLDDLHLEFRPEDYVRAAQIRRAAWVRLTWVR
jgi:iron complex outermembrane recepter protein